MASNVDRKDVIRGQCLANNCDCEEFELDDKSQFCGYCDDAPTKHKRIGKTVSQCRVSLHVLVIIMKIHVQVKINQGHTPDAVETPRPITLSEVEHEPADEHETESEPNCQDEIAAISEDVEREGRTINPLSEVLKYVPTQKKSLLGKIEHLDGLTIHIEKQEFFTILFFPVSTNHVGQ